MNPVVGSNNAAIPYASSPTLFALSEFTDGASMFSNANSADCGGFTTCYPKPSGCSGSYAGKASITS